MTLSELLKLFRLEVDDAVEPYLWSDEEFFVYLNEAQDLHVRMIGGIADRRSPFTKIAYKAGDQFKKYDERIIRIKGAFNQDNRIITIQNLDNFETSYLEDDYGSLAQSGLDNSQTGDIKYLVNDVENGEFQLYPIPEADGWIRMYVYRRPLEVISSCESEPLEISSYYHLNLLNWVKYSAFMKQDAEVFNGSKAAEFRLAFTVGVEDAKREKSAREDRKRTVSYGGIPMR